MQKTFVKIISKKILTTAFIAGAVVMAASAEPDNKVEIVSANIQSVVEFAGAVDNTFFFDVKITNPGGETITVEVQNDDGEVLFSKKCSGQTIVKKIKLLNEELTAHYNFIIRPENNEAAQTFVVSITTRIVENAATV